MNQHDPSGEIPADVPRANEPVVPAESENPAAMAAVPTIVDVAADVVETAPVEAAGESAVPVPLAAEAPAAEVPEIATAEASSAVEAVASAEPEAEVAASAADEGAVEQSEEAASEGAVEEPAIAAGTSPRRSEPEPEPDEPVAPAEPMCWYVLKVQSNRERTIRDSLLRRIKRDGLEPYFGEIVIPTEKRVETKGGKKRVFEHKLYPGYIMIHMSLNDETWYLVRDTSGVGDFTGAAGKPLPMPEEEVRKMISRTKEGEQSDQPARVKINFATGDAVKIKEGPFESFEGSINSIDEANGKVSVLIEIFGRSTPVDLEYWQVERV